MVTQSQVEYKVNRNLSVKHITTQNQFYIVTSLGKCFTISRILIDTVESFINFGKTKILYGKIHEISNVSPILFCENVEPAFTNTLFKFISHCLTTEFLISEYLLV